ncbi:hypothetical protein NDU88_001815 [Pleurodeles waltl]|uniref:Uncharacterized protein n=1 Tax=Pleurodeles waltl TaxID=8319 RepID=A0AAV7W0K1_PLEWA|nr:hypothetical protein NDU88_001815 [Pleurodeles waltl]
MVAGIRVTQGTDAEEGQQFEGGRVRARLQEAENSGAPTVLSYAPSFAARCLLRTTFVNIDGCFCSRVSDIKLLF